MMARETSRRAVQLVPALSAAATISPRSRSVRVCCTVAQPPSIRARARTAYSLIGPVHLKTMSINWHPKANGTDVLGRMRRSAEVSRLRNEMAALERLRESAPAEGVRGAIEAQIREVQRELQRVSGSEARV